MGSVMELPPPSSYIIYNKLIVTMWPSSSDEYVCMKSMVCDYTTVQREINEPLSKTTKITETAGKQYVRQALDH